MEKDKLTLRVADISDAEAILKIYAPYIERTAITFECKVPTVSEFEERISHILPFYPYIVAEFDGEIVGYSYASPFHPREAYRWDVVVSIYLDMKFRRLGIGKILYRKMEEILKAQNFLSMYASIANADGPDEYVTNGSIDFHKHMGFYHVARFPKCGYKFGRWYNLHWFEKVLGEHGKDVLPVVPFEEIRDRFFPAN